MTHFCHAEGCNREVPRELLMCRSHWGRVPVEIRRRVLAYYQSGQCDGNARIHPAWLLAAREAVDAVRRVETEEARR